MPHDDVTPHDVAYWTTAKLELLTQYRCPECGRSLSKDAYRGFSYCAHKDCLMTRISKAAIDRLRMISHYGWEAGTAIPLPYESYMGSVYD